MRLLGSISLAVPIPGKGSPAGSESFLLAGNTQAQTDETAFRELYNDVAPKLRAYIRRACADAALADDLLQETFFRFLRANLPPLERWQRKAYLYRTASSLLTDHWRRLARERRWRLERLLGGDTEPAEEPNHESTTMSLFRRLKPRQQALLWLAYVEGFDHREIALALQLSEKSVRVLLFRARKEFGEVLQKQGPAVAQGSIPP